MLSFINCDRREKLTPSAFSSAAHGTCKSPLNARCSLCIQQLVPLRYAIMFSCKPCTAGYVRGAAGLGTLG